MRRVAKVTSISERVRAQMEDGARAIATVLGGLRRQFGEESVGVWGDESKEVEALSTGREEVDRALGCGGLPRGRIVEIFGEPSSGKTTLALLAIASCQASGGIAAFIDAEHALDPAYARRLGVELKALIVSQPSSGEQALEMIDAMARSRAIDLIVVDSVAALVPRAELEGALGDDLQGLQARMMSQALRRITQGMAGSRATVVFLNQLRSRLGAFLGSEETTTGGRALRYYSSIRMELRRLGWVRAEGRVVGSRVGLRVVKNKVSDPFGEAQLELRAEARQIGPARTVRR